MTSIRAIGATDEDGGRRIVLEAVHNFRDLGGYLTDDGRMTRWGVLYRADGLGAMTDADLEILRPLGLRTVIDLRTEGELAERGRFPHERYEVDFAHLPILDVLWDHSSPDDERDDSEFLVAAYRYMLEVGERRFAAAIMRLAAPGALPAVFHSAAGKDRTGLLAALLLSAIGVRRDDVLADYALTAAGIERMTASIRGRSQEDAERLAAVPSWLFAALPAALDHILTDLCTVNGSIRAYLHTLGVDESALAALERELLTDPTS